MKQNNCFLISPDYICYSESLNADGVILSSVKSNFLDINLLDFIDCRRRLSFCLLTTFFLLLLSPNVFNKLGLDFNIINKFNQYIESFLFSIVYFYGGFPFYNKAIFKLRSSNILFIQLVGILDATIYLCGIFSIFDFYDDIIYLNIITFIDYMLIFYLISLKASLIIFIENNHF